MAESDAPGFPGRPLRAVVTRPLEESGKWVTDLRRNGIEAVALPLITIGPVVDPRPIQEAWKSLGGYAAVMFVSGNAVAHFFEQKKDIPSVKWSQYAIHTRAWATGAGTVGALLRAGLSAGQIDAPDADAAQFDSEALWARISQQASPGRRVLIVRGGDGNGKSTGRDWLADRLAQAEVQVDRLVAYRRMVPSLAPDQVALAQQAATDGSVWLFSSSEAIGNLRALLGRQDWGKARAVATHPRIALAARNAGFGVVCESRPAFDAMLRSIKSFA